ncbi:MAG TPA: c-type cytochrome [Vicinamibacterales bacterium]|jgi:cytochrome c5
MVPGVWLLWFLVLGSVASGQQLPAGPGADVLKSRCVICHESDIITSQKLTLTGWTNSINKMVRWGSTITQEERDVLQPYLAMHYGPKPAASHTNTDAGAATYARACQTCHGTDIIEQQKLTKTGWTRSVEKMMRWGAQVTEADKEALVEYLASRLPPR